MQTATTRRDQLTLKQKKISNRLSCSYSKNDGKSATPMLLSPKTLSVNPRAHQQQCRSSIVECYKWNDFYGKVECCSDIVASVDGALVELRMFCLTPDGVDGDHCRRRG